MHSDVVAVVVLVSYVNYYHRRRIFTCYNQSHIWITFVIKIRVIIIYFVLCKYILEIFVTCYVNVCIMIVFCYLLCKCVHYDCVLLLVM